MDPVESPTERAGPPSGPPSSPTWQSQSLKLTDAQRTAVTGGVMLGMFLGALEATVVSTAMPTVISELKGLSIYSWVFSGYILTSTITVPIWGRLSDLFGRKRFYLLGIGIFMLGSALAGLAQTMSQLVIFRAIQGIGAGALLPLGMTIIGEIYTLEKRARMQGIFSGVWGAASIIGPLIGGFITDYMNWRWVFYLNIPFGFASMAVLGMALVEPVETHRKISLDYAGIALLAGAITALLLGLMSGGAVPHNWTAPATLGLFVASALMLILFLGAETRAEHPIVPLGLFKERILSVSSANGFFVGMAMFGSLSFIPLFVQAVIGTSATEAGSTITPFMLAWVASSTVGGRLMLRTGYRVLAVIGVGCLVLGFGLMSLLDTSATRWDVIRTLIFAGIGMGLCLVTLTIAVQNSISRDRLGIATSATIFFRSIGGAVGVAIMGAAMSTRMHAQIDQLIHSGTSQLSLEALQRLAEHPDQIANPLARQNLSPEELSVLQSALSMALHHVFIVGFVIALLAFVVTLFLPGGKMKDQWQR